MNIVFKEFLFRWWLLRTFHFPSLYLSFRCIFVGSQLVGWLEFHLLEMSIDTLWMQPTNDGCRAGNDHFSTKICHDWLNSNKSINVYHQKLWGVAYSQRLSGHLNVFLDSLSRQWTALQRWWAIGKSWEQMWKMKVPGSGMVVLAGPTQCHQRWGLSAGKSFFRQWTFCYWDIIEWNVHGFSKKPSNDIILLYVDFP